MPAKVNTILEENSSFSVWLVLFCLWGLNALFSKTQRKIHKIGIWKLKLDINEEKTTERNCYIFPEPDFREGRRVNWPGASTFSGLSPFSLLILILSA